MEDKPKRSRSTRVQREAKQTKGADAELTAHMLKSPDDEFVRGAKQGSDGSALGVSLSPLYSTKGVKIGGVDIDEWYTKEVDASGKGIRPWDRRPDEPIEKYQAFVMWLFSGVDKDKTNKPSSAPRRLYSQAWRNYLAITGQEEAAEENGATRCPKTWCAWASKYDWESRAISYDRQDLEEFGEKMALARRDIEDRVGDALLKGLQTCVGKLEQADLQDLSVSAAIYALVQISQELRNFVAFTERGKPSASTVLESLPEGLRQAVLVAINVDQIVVQRQKEDDTKVIDAK